MVSSTSTPIPFEILPGVYRDLTEKQASTRICDGNYIRTIAGRVGSIGGWAQQVMAGTILGIPRSHRWWRALDGVEYGVVGTHKALYVISGRDTYSDITPLRQSSSLNNAITTINLSPTVTITDAGHGAQAGDLVFFPASVTYNGVTLFGVYEIVTAPDINTYTLLTTTPASGSGSGGGVFDVDYYIPTGFADDATTPGGYGTGTWGTETWGTPRSAGAPVKARVWSLQNFGEDILAVPTRGGKLYFWDTSVGVLTRAQEVSTAPSRNDFMLVTSALRQCVLFGTEDVSNNYDPMLIRGSNSEDYTDFDPTTVGSTAWEYRLTNGNYIVGAIETTTNELLVWTDLATYRLRLTGDDDIYALEHLTDGSDLVGPNAMCEVEGTVYWVCSSGLRAYNGSVSIRPTTMDTYYFDSQKSPNSAMNLDQRTKIFMGVNSLYNEIWIWMPTGASTEISRYMIVDYKEGAFCDGSLSRTSWSDRAIEENPTAFNSSGVLYAHEVGTTADGQPLNPWFRTGYSIIDEGLYIGLTDFVVPDGDYNTACQLTIFGKDQPRKPAFVTKTKTVSTTTGRVDIHVRARYLSLQWAAPLLNGSFLLGKFHVAMIPDGKR